MGIDSSSIMIYFSGSIFITIILFLFYLYSSKQKNWFTKSYIISKALQLFAVVGIILRDVIPDFISIDLSAVILLASYSFETYSIISYDGKIRRKVLIFLISLFVLSSALFTSFSYHEAYRSIITSLSAAIIFSIGGVDLFIFRKKLKFPILLGIVFILFSIIQLARGILILLEVHASEQPNNITPLDDIFYIIAFIYLTMSSVGFLLLMKEFDEETLSKRNTELKEITLTKNKLFSIIAHDLKSPIAALSSIGQILLEQHNELTPNQREEIINDITNSSKNTFDLLNNILLWTQSEIGELRANFDEINLSVLITNNLKTFKHAFENKHINTEIKLDKNALIIADKNMVNTVIRNLFSNAVKFTPEGGNVIISTNVNKDGSSYMTISDNGIGIEPEIAENLFNLNPDQNTRGTNSESGTGLGLKLCKEFIDKNNGSITVNSTPDSGSTFVVRFPKHK